eukprot:gnl/TRDRNA2_/TRDRNA2_133328_c0_seq1.p1 gnl/TRDRNA2_/TRDRNA2_133328_c0~~gnl/TRDRNA2_/TRDRNA2_133328_c0_seq1.p1  ORF type:complete len:528 (-),score=91.35 gnl/TRDRNA2_/TRDRNA2_133328_c0_seq1:93-1676(-)
MDEWVSPAVAIAPSLENGKGRGLVTARPVAFLETLFVAKPFVVASADAICTECRKVLADPNVEQRRKAQFWALSDGSSEPLAPIDIGLFSGNGSFASPPPTAHRSGRVRGILETNAQGMESFASGASIDILPVETVDAPTDPELCGLWLLPSLLNHSCIPTVSWVALDNKGTICVFAACDLNAGMELTDTYLNLFSPLSVRQEELRSQKGFVCACARCEIESSALPRGAADGLLSRQALADASLKRAGAIGLAEWLRETDAIRTEADRVIVKAGGDKAMLRAAFMQADVTVAQTLCGIVQELKTALVEKHDLRRRAAVACTRVVESVSAVAPLSMYHVHFLWLALGMWSQAGGDAASEAAATAQELVVTWCGRHGISLRWPDDLSDRCCAAFRRRGGPAGAAVARAVECALARLVPPTDSSQQWRRIVQRRALDRGVNIRAQEDAGTHNVACSCDAGSSPPSLVSPRVATLPGGDVCITWQLGGSLPDVSEVTVDVSAEVVRLGGAVKATEVKWPAAVDELEMYQTC